MAFSSRGTRLIKGSVRPLFHGAVRVALSAVFTLLALLEILWGPLAYADDLAACVSQKVQFDGTVPLKYASVNDSSGLRLYLHKGYSDNCSSGDPASCLKTAYLVPGDAVAIGKQCGARDYVQYIGEERISEGWVDAAALNLVAPPPEPTPPVPQIGKRTRPSKPSLYRFALTQGKGLPVCEAYQQRLNQTEFYAPPYCGRPESALVPGFELLNRKSLTADEYRALFWKAMEALNNESPDSNYVHKKNTDGTISMIPPPVPTFTAVPDTWTYDPSLDIENSGNTDNVVMWSAADTWRCGLPGNLDGSDTRGASSGLIMSTKDKTINSEATYAVFGRSDLDRFRKYRNTYLELSTEFGIFRYKNLNYFDAMFNPQAFDSSLQDTLAVFLYANHERKEICEYRVSGLRGYP